MKEVEETKAPETIVISAISKDYSEKSYQLFFGVNQFEFIPKSQCEFLENAKGKDEFGIGIESRFFRIPLWIFNKLKGKDYYGNENE